MWLQWVVQWVLHETGNSQQVRCRCTVSCTVSCPAAAPVSLPMHRLATPMTAKEGGGARHRPELQSKMPKPGSWKSVFKPVLRGQHALQKDHGIMELHEQDKEGEHAHVHE